MNLNFQVESNTMSHYMSNHRLTESNMSFVNQLSTVSIPNSVHEALTDPR
jgi:hypothetical protein